jgi:two-component system LytT family sensor kinase
MVPSSQRAGTALTLSVSVVALTLLFTAQDVMRRTALGVSVNWGLTLRINALDWVSWSALFLLIVVPARRFRLDGTGHRAGRVAVWVAIAGLAVTAQGIITGVVLRWWGVNLMPPGVPSPPLGRYLYTWTLNSIGFNLPIFLMIAGVFHAALYYRDMRERQLREAALEGRLARAELNVLRMQIQPHFLYNALHTISSLIETDAGGAQRVVAALGDLLRSSLDQGARQEVTLRDELAFVGRYLDIQKARFRTRLTVAITADDAVLDSLVPSLVLQPLVENAIRHGIENRTAGGTVWIRAARDGDVLALSVRDDGAPAPAAVPGAGAGVGLSNIAGRLAQLYGSAHTFRAARSADGHFEVSLTLPLHTDPALYPVAR